MLKALGSICSGCRRRRKGKKGREGREEQREGERKGEREGEEGEGEEEGEIRKAGSLGWVCISRTSFCLVILESPWAPSHNRAAVSADVRTESHSFLPSLAFNTTLPGICLVSSQGSYLEWWFLCLFLQAGHLLGPTVDKTMNRLRRVKQE